MDISSLDISVIVQGNPHPKTAAGIVSLRRWLPQAEIILSTWEGAPCEGLGADAVVLSPDPGAGGLIRRFPHEQRNQVNRLIVSARAGLQRASRPFCLKLRCGMQLRSAGFLHWYNRFADSVTEDSLFRSRVMADGLGVTPEAAFAVGDAWYFGRKEDLLALLDIPPYDEKRGEEYFLKQENARKRPYLTEMVCRVPPGQYVISAFLHKHYSFRFEHFLDNSPQNAALSEQFVRRNLICLESRLSGVAPDAENDAEPFGVRHGTTLYRWSLQCAGLRGFPRLGPLEKARLALGDGGQRRLYAARRRYWDLLRDIGAQRLDAEPVALEPLETAPVSAGQITFVVSGLLGEGKEFNMRRCLLSIRRCFPKSGIILSVWDDTSLAGLAGLYDDAVFCSKKDAPTPYSTYLRDQPRKVNTTNAQQLCVHAGLTRVRTPYAVRMRSDFALGGDAFLRLYNRWSGAMDSTDAGYRLFQRRVLVPNIITRDARMTGGELVYQLSDLFSFGRTQDLLKLWDGSQSGRDTLNYFEDHPASLLHNPLRFNHLFTAEQYFFLDCIRREKLPIRYPAYYLDRSSEDFVWESEKVYAANCLIFPLDALQLQSKFRDMEVTPEFFSLERFAELYLIHIDPRSEACRAFLLDSAPGREPGGLTRRAGRAARGRLKTLLRAVSPAYRVSLQTREMLAAQIEESRRQHAGTLRAIGEGETPDGLSDRLENARTAWFSELSALVAPPEWAGKRVLAVDCGYGALGAFLLASGARVCFADRRRECCDILRRKFPGCRVEQAPAGAPWPFDKTSGGAAFDLIIDVGLLTYGFTQQLDAWFKHARRVVFAGTARVRVQEGEDPFPAVRSEGALAQGVLLLRGCGYEEDGIPADPEIPELAGLAARRGWSLRLGPRALELRAREGVVQDVGVWCLSERME